MSSLKQQLNQHSKALLLITVLILMKFIVLPIIQWQETTLTTNTLLEKRLSKSAYAINNKIQMQQVLKQSTVKLSELEQLIYEYQLTNRFRLSQQKQLETLFEEYKIEITNLVWQAPVALTNWQISQHEVKLRIKGSLTNLQKLQAVLESKPQWLANNSFSYRLEKRRKNNLGNFSGRTSLTLYMKNKI